MRIRSTLPLLGIGALVLSACSTTVLSSAPETTATTLPPATVPEPVVTEPEPVDEPATTTSSTTTSSTTTSSTTTTTTTSPPSIALDSPLEAVGTNSGDETRRLQERLLELGFWLGATDGQYGVTTRQAVMAAQKYLGLTADGVAGPETVAQLSNLTEEPRGRAEAGTLVEVDKSRQLLFFVIDGVTEWILNTSTGTEIPYERPNSNDPEIIESGSSITPTGLHEVDRQRAEGWWEGDLGEIYRPKYFVGGVAVHGSNSIPDYPASHGCVRVSVPAMDWIWEQELMPMSSPVWVYGEIPG
ncbi:MAG: L,D-transpeptidase family protein [Ilumatobacteraceae bacterium]